MSIQSKRPKYNNLEDTLMECILSLPRECIRLICSYELCCKICTQRIYNSDIFFCPNGCSSGAAICGQCIRHYAYTLTEGGCAKCWNNDIHILPFLPCSATMGGVFFDEKSSRYCMQSCSTDREETWSFFWYDSSTHQFRIRHPWYFRASENQYDLVFCYSWSSEFMALAGTLCERYAEGY